jgi:regulator of nucleoside diphosphate kinase
MKARPIFITEQDRNRLQRLIESQVADNADARYVDALAGELRRATFVPPNELPADVVSMDSTVRLCDLDTGECETYTVVYPPHADAENGRISVLAPIGTAIVGCQVGDVIKWPVPDGIRRLKVEDVLFQPERAGDVAMAS